MGGWRVLAGALRWRPGTALATLLVAVTSVAAAVTAPLWARAAQESLLATRLTTTPVAQLGLVASAATSSATSSDRQALVDATASAVSDLRFDRWFGPTGRVVRTSEPIPLLRPGRSTAFDSARVAWVDGVCAHLVITGRCPSGPGDALVSELTARTLGITIGDPAGLTSTKAGSGPHVVGTYAPPRRDDPFWFGYDYVDHGSVGSDALDQLDTIFVDASALDVFPSSTLVIESHRALDPAGVDLGSAGAVRTTVADAVAASGHSTGAVRLTSSLPAVLDEVAADGRTVEVASVLVSVQLLVLTWYVLFLLVAATVEERSDEVVVARLRGLGGAATARLAVAEPALLLVAAIPLGALAAYLLARALVAGFLPAGTPVVADGTAVLAGAVALAGGLVAALLAVRRVLRQPVLALLRRSGTRRSWARSAALDAVVLTLTVAAMLGLLRRDGADASSDVLVLLLPALLAFSLGLLGTRLLPLALQLGVRATRGGSRGATWLGLRQAARRRGGTRTAVLLTVATALAVFAVDAFQAAATTRASQAAALVGADRVLQVDAPSLPRLVAAVDAADPTGRAALPAAEVIPYGEQGRIVAVDATRLAAVSAWQGSWADIPVAQLAAALHPPAAAPLVLAGPDLELAATWTPSDEEVLGRPAKPVTGPVTLVADLRGSDGTTYAVPLGTLREGRATYAGSLDGCVAPCALAGLHLDRGAGVVGDIVGRLQVDSLASPSGTPLPAAVDPARWVAPRTSVTDPSRTPAVQPAGNGPVAWTLRASDSDPVLVRVAEAPRDLPVVVPAGVDVNAYPGEPGRISGSALDGTPAVLHLVGRSEVIPRSLAAGSLVDLRYAALQTPDAQPTRLEVWLSPTAGPEVLQRLAAHGVTVTGTERLSTVRQRLDRSASALSFLLLLFAAIAALALAVAGVVTDLFVVGRRRSREAAALRAVGLGPARCAAPAPSSSCSCSGRAPCWACSPAGSRCASRSPASRWAPMSSSPRP